MFYCAECAKKRLWPVTMFQSRGPCETCGRRSAADEATVQRRTRPLRITRALFAVVLFADLAACALDLAAGHSGTAILMAFAATLVAATVVLQTFTIRRMRAQEIQELNRRADRLELAADAVREGAVTGMTTTADLMAGMARLSTALGGCAHPDAEAVDLLLTGERVGWICPACNAELPAGWTPAKGTGTLTATGTMGMSPVAALSGSGTLSAKAAVIWCTCPPDACAPVGVRVYDAGVPVIRYCRACGKRIAPLPDEQVPESKALSAKATWDDVAYASEASEHFAQLARVGRESCASPCRLCEARDRHYPTAEARALLSAKLAGFKDDASLRDWIEKGRFS